MLKKLWIGLLSLLLSGVVSCGIPLTSTSTPPPTLPTSSTTEATATPTPSGFPPQLQNGLSLPSIADIVDRVRPAVVAIFTEGLAPDVFLRPVPVRGAGSGFIFRSDGYILTNNHVVEDATTITVNLPESASFPEGASFDGKIVGRDPQSDLAVIKIEAKNLPTIAIGDSSQLRLGEWVIAIGNAQALSGGPTVTQGIVSAIGRSITLSESGRTLHDLIQTDAAINPGNSGGPLLNLRGEVVGINSAIVSGAENIGFAIATTTAVPIRDELLAAGRIRWGWLGVSISDLTSARADELRLAVKKGVFIEDVFQGNPAERAGLRKGDVIVRLAGIDTPTVSQFQKAIRKYRAGVTVNITFVHNGQTQTIAVTLSEVPSTLPSQ